MKTKGVRRFLDGFTGLTAWMRGKKQKPCKWLDPVIALMLAGLTLLFSVM